MPHSASSRTQRILARTQRILARTQRILARAPRRGMQSSNIMI
jgi:hypothetical protein